LEDDEEEGDGPTRVMGQQQLRSQVEAPLFGVKTDDTSTLVRQAPGGREYEEDQETVVRKVSSVLEVPGANLRAPEEPETLIRRRGPQDPSTPELSLDPSTSVGGARPSPVIVAPVGPVGVPSWVWLAGAGVGTLGLLAGVFVGTVAGAVAGALLAPAPEAALPVLQVEAPPGATVSVDGAPVTGSVSLAPGQIHAVAVHLAGRTSPLRANVTLRSGEVRVLVITEVNAP
jgi:hypothetical protein